MDKQSILIISHFFPPESLGGAHRWQKLIENAPEEIDFRVLCPPPTYPFGEFDHTFSPVEQEEINGVSVTRLWTYQPTSDSRATDTNLGRILNYAVFSVLATLYTAVSFWRYDTVLTVSTPHTTFLPGVVGKALGCNWVVDVFDLWLDNARDLGYVERGTVPHLVVSVLEHVAMTRSDHVFVITETMADVFTDRYDVQKNRFTVVPFGVDTELFEPSSTDRSTTRLIYTGNLGDCHAFVPYLEALARLDPEYELRIVGTGKRRNELVTMCEQLGIDDRVVFEGVKPREKIPELLSTAGVSIVPLKKGQNLDYARPNKLLESMAAGTPYVASDVEEVRVVTEEAGAGLAVENDPESLVNAFREITQEETKRTEMSDVGPAYIKEHHHWGELGSTVGRILHAL